jgi:molecular chaperone GrpE
MNDTENTPSESPDEMDAPDNVESLADAAKPTPEEVLVAQVDDLRDRLLRAVADADNTRKRAEKEVRDTREYAVSSFAKDMVDVADNLARALSTIEEADMDTASDAMKTLVEGVAMTERALLSKMERHNVKKIDPQLGDNFDPHIHQAVAQIPSDQAVGKIATVMQTGFVIGSRTLRAAMVAVSAGTPAGTPPPSGETGGNIDMKA